MLTIYQFRENYDSFRVNQIRVAGNQRNGRPSGWFHHTDFGGFDNAGAGYSVDLILQACGEDDFVAGFQLIQVSKQLAKNVIVG